LATITKVGCKMADERCRMCHSPLGAESSFCPFCGAPRAQPCSRSSSSPPEPLLIIGDDGTESEEIEAIFVS
jgi:hypothetical protein